MSSQRKLYMQAWRALNKERLNAERRKKYSEDQEYKERVKAYNRSRWNSHAEELNAKRRLRRSGGAGNEDDLDMLPLPWDADISQERALAEIEGRDPGAAEEAWKRTERGWGYSTYPQSAMAPGWDPPEEDRVVPSDVLACLFCGYKEKDLQVHVQEHIGREDSLPLVKFLDWMNVGMSEKARQDLADVKVKLFR